MEPLNPGLYEALLTERLKQKLLALGDKAKLEKLDKSETPALLAQHLQSSILAALESEDGEDHIEKRLRIINGLLETLAKLAPESSVSPLASLEQSLCGVLSTGRQTNNARLTKNLAR